MMVNGYMIVDNSLITTESIIECIVGSQGLPISSNGYKCYINLYKCNLKENYVHELFGFEIDSSISAFNPDIYINVPSGTCKEIYKHEIEYSHAAREFMNKLIPDKIKSDFGVEFVSVTFSILHEIGHWKHFCDLNYSPMEYCKYDALERKEFFDLYANHLVSYDAFCRYRDIASEKAADKYALAYIQSSIELITKK